MLMLAGQLALALLLIGAFLFVALLWLAVIWSMRKGLFRVRLDTAEWFVVETDFGVVRVHHPKRTFTVTTPKGTQACALTDIASVRFTQDDTWAYMAEFLTGFDITDLLGRYQDRINWYTIKLKLKDGRDIPIFTAGGYEPREFLCQWWVNGETSILARAGLLKDVKGHAHSALDQVLQGFRKGGIHVPFP